MSILEEWLRDIPQQFQNKKRFTILFRAFAKQLKELEQVFEELNTKTNLDTAKGKLLDEIGTICSLTRKEAGELAGIGVTEPIISDERYRQVLKYRILRNTSECTYEDIRTGLEYLYSYPFRYREEPEYPATILLNLPRISVDDPDLAFYRKLCIKPSGVKILAIKSFFNQIEIPIAYNFYKLTIQSKFYSRSNIPFLRYDGTAQYNGTVRYDKYRTKDRIDLYPIRFKITSENHPRMFFFPTLRLREIFSVPAVFEPKINYQSKSQLPIEIETKATMKKEVPLTLPHYEINLKIGRHPNRYDGTVRYDGTSRYYVASEEML